MYKKNDVILVDNALNESMLNPRLLGKADSSQNKRKDVENMKNNEENDEAKNGDTFVNGTQNDVNDTVDDIRNEITETGDRSNDDTMIEENNEVEKTVIKKNENVTADETKITHKVRRSSRNRKQRINDDNDEIGDCDDKNDPDYK